jgi:metal-responsive CopG/Arc/MetJ family transcriptional regulator
MSKNMVRYAVELSPELAEKFEEMAEQEHASRSDIIRKALFLMYVAINSKKKGRELAVVDKLGHKVSDIIL